MNTTSPNGRNHLLAIALRAMLGLTLVGMNVSQAQTPSGSDDDKKSGGGLTEIIVTATRHEESLSKVALSVTALTQESLDLRGVKDFNDVARFTPGVNVDNSGTNNISIRGIASSGGAGTTGIYIDDTPIQIRALAFNPNEALPKSFDVERVEVLRGPQGTLFGAGSEGGTVRFITTPASLTKTSGYSREEVSFTQGGAPSYEAGGAFGTPIIDGTLGIRASVWYRRDGGYIDQINPVTQSLIEKNANYDQTTLIRLSAIWAVSDAWTVTPSIYYQDRYRNSVENYWPLYSNPGAHHFVNGDPDPRPDPDTFYLPALKIEGDLGKTRLISNTSYFHRNETTGYDGTLYNIGYFQAQGAAPVFPVSALNTPGGNGCPAGVNSFPLLDGAGLHLPCGLTNYRSPATVDNQQRNFTQEIRLQSNNPDSKLVWTTGLFYSQNKQSYLEQIHDPMLPELSLALTGQPYTNFFTDADGAPVLYDPRFPTDSYFLQTHAKDTQLAVFGEGSYAFTDQWKLTLGARYSKTQFSFDTLTGGPELFSQTKTGNGDKKETSFTPKVSLAFQADRNNLYYATYSKGFRPGGANNPVPASACGTDFTNFGITQAPTTFNSDTVNSFEVGAKNNFNNRLKIASSIYYIRWNNIQQTVVPPICQISFIDNLGTAVAKGGDIQIEYAMTDSLTGNLSAGYTSARYTQDSRFSSAQQTPIVAAGDAIAGQSAQPGAPVTLSLGLEYRFSLFERESFLRIDDEYQSKANWPAPNQDGQVATGSALGLSCADNNSGRTLQFDCANYTLRSTNFASARAGMTFGAWQFSAFIDNLTDTHTVTNYSWTIDPGVSNTSRLPREFTFRPRTFGLSMTYRR